METAGKRSHSHSSNKSSRGKNTIDQCCFQLKKNQRVLEINFSTIASEDFFSTHLNKSKLMQRNQMRMSFVSHR